MTKENWNTHWTSSHIIFKVFRFNQTFNCFSISFKLISTILSVKMKKCRHCSEEILYSAKVCRYCNRKTEKSNIILNMIRLGVLVWIFLCIICEWLFRWFDENNIIARPIWTPMHKLSMYQNCQKTDLSNTEWLYSRVVNVPSSPIIN